MLWVDNAHISIAEITAPANNHILQPLNGTFSYTNDISLCFAPSPVSSLHAAHIFKAVPFISPHLLPNLIDTSIKYIHTQRI